MIKFPHGIRRRLTLVFGLTLAAGLLARQPGGWQRMTADAAPSTNQAELPVQVPPGFVIELVAGPPLVEHPVMAGFDDRGRLFVAESAGQNLKSADLLKQLPNSVRLLESSKGDGRFDKFTVFADQMTFPMGSLWHDGALYVCSPPSLWRLVDTKGTGVADQRQELVTRFGFTGNAADIHGPFASPDGRLYWTDGRHGHEIQRPDGTVMKGKAARIFRCKPDGSDVEVVCGGGMDDPVGMAFTEEGEPFATVDILIGSPRRIDGIIYCIEGGVYPYYESVLNEFKRTGDLLPPIVDLGWVAPSGMMRYHSSAFGAAYRDNLFSAQFNTHKVQRHILERDGGAFRSRTEDFLVSTSPDFHPTDVLEDADGSLLVIDTGGWFRIGCPTSQIAKPEVKGAIYRVRRKDAAPVTDPRGQALQWNQLPPRELAKVLDDSRWVVRDRAVQQLAKQKDQALPALQNVLANSVSVQARRNAVWALNRIESDPARRLVRTALDADADASVRIAAARSVGLYRDHLAGAVLTRLIQKDTPAVRREAAAALGRIGRSRLASSPIPALLKALESECDRFLEHALIFALIELKAPEETSHGLRDPSPRVRRAALIALDQMDGGNLTREQVLPQLDTDDSALQKTAWAMITARPEWAGEVSGLLRDWLARTELPAARQEMLRTALLAFCKDQAVQDLVAQSLVRSTTPTATRLLVLETIAQAPLDKLPKSWIAELGRGLQDREERVRRQTVVTLRTRGVTDHDEALMRLAADQAQPAELRVAALGAVAPRLARLEPSLFDFLRTRLDKELPPLARLAAADALGSCKLSRDQLLALTEAVARAGSMEIPHLIAAYERAPDPEVGQKLLAALDQSPGLTSLSPDNLRRTLKGYPVEIQQAATSLLKRLEVDTEKQKAKLEELAPLLGKGDARRGRVVFFGKKAACATCHAVGAEGGRVGPDLTKIGGIRTGNDLLESVVFPSASMVRGYEPYIILTQDGRSHQGIIGRETVEAVYLINAERAEMRIPRSAIESIERSRVSIMPQGLDAQLNRQELGDLIAYMQSLR